MDREVQRGEIVCYFDEDGVRYPAIVAWVYPGVQSISQRPICNLTTIKPDAKFGPRMKIEPAYHDGIRWRLLNKWAFDGEVPEEEWIDKQPDWDSFIRGPRK